MAVSETYEDLNNGLKVIVEDVRTLVGDRDSESPWFEGDNDDYVSFLRSVVFEINATQPFTSFEVSNVPTRELGALLHLGLTCKTIEARMNQWVEVPGLSGFSGPYADESQFLQRWQSRYQDLKQRYDKMRGSNKLMFLPGAAASVGLMFPHTGGAGYNPVPILLRGMPTWYYQR